MMQKLALLAFACIAFSYEGNAQDAQYVRDRAAMVKTIQAHALKIQIWVYFTGMAETI